MCIVNLSFMTWPLARHKSNDKIHQIHPTSEEHVEVNNIEPMNTPASPSNRKKKRKSQQTHTRIPFFITNLSSTSRVVLPKDHVIAFITPEDPEANYIEIAEVESVEEQCRNWKCPTKMLPKAPESDFLGITGRCQRSKEVYIAWKWYFWQNLWIISPTSQQISSSLFEQ